MESAWSLLIREMHVVESNHKHSLTTAWYLGLVTRLQALSGGSYEHSEQRPSSSNNHCANTRILLLAPNLVAYAAI